MERQRKTIEPGRVAGTSNMLPGLVLLLVVGGALWFEFASDAESERASAPIPTPVAAVLAEPSTAAEVPVPAREAPIVEPQVVIPPPPLPEQRVAVDPQSLVPSGRAGVVEALRRGEIRTGSRADIERWSVVARASGLEVDPQRIGGEGLDVMVIQQDFVVPAGLHGANAVIFVLERGVPFPRGELGHAVVLDMQSGACVGAICRMILAP